MIVGSAGVEKQQSHAFRWDAVNGMVDLGSLVPGKASSAQTVSANGYAVMGWTIDPSVASRIGTQRAGVVYMNGVSRFIHPFDWAGEGRATIDVASTIVGRFHPSNTVGATTWRWSASNGRLEDLGAIPLLNPGNASEY